ncbi:DUF6470 family protein [Domibacillus sp. PGB-M46]|uniref:DUF6470 family protein n=1 Tax=Domibacillus sp. PGB-M46 TaxID=2910255 RepID=UPI001F568CDE|nr:DUF6470 family protein [Domibacillus sp. PGB-M46]MCI2253003.1 DUF6470 family protein [Domibacillus sp. PGB-M46]
MNMPTIQINQTRAQIQISSTPGRQTIQQAQATVELSQPRPEVKLSITPGRLSIDQTEAWADMDRKNIFRRTREEAAEGRQKAAEGIARRAAEGRELAAIEKDGNPIVSQAMRNTTRNYQTGIAWIPSPGSVKFHYQPGTVKADVNVQPIVNNSHANKTTVTYQPGGVNIQLKQKSSIDFKAVDKTI